MGVNANAFREFAILSISISNLSAFLAFASIGSSFSTGGVILARRLPLSVNYNEEELCFNNLLFSKDHFGFAAKVIIPIQSSLQSRRRMLLYPSRR
jgi:hypothetical protein